MVTNTYVHCDWAMGTSTDNIYNNKHGERCVGRTTRERMKQCSHEGCKTRVHIIWQRDWLDRHGFNVNNNDPILCQQHDQQHQGNIERMPRLQAHINKQIRKRQNATVQKEDCNVFREMVTTTAEQIARLPIRTVRENDYNLLQHDVRCTCWRKVTWPGLSFQRHHACTNFTWLASKRGWLMIRHAPCVGLCASDDSQYTGISHMSRFDYSMSRWSEDICICRYMDWKLIGYLYCFRYIIGASLFYSLSPEQQISLMVLYNTIVWPPIPSSSCTGINSTQYS